MPVTTPLPVRSRWQTPEIARRYAGDEGHARWRSPRRARRDGQLIERALRRFASEADMASVLDVPCGTGRLAPLLSTKSERYVGIDVSAAMIERARSEGPGSHETPGLHAVADAATLPFADRSFGTVIACRLLHHIVDDAELRQIVAELVRVSSGLVVASFWNARSWQARRPGKRRDADGR